jgi:hypothetical protein
MSNPRRAEVERLATSIWDARREQIIHDSDEQRSTPHRTAAARGNLAGVLPALIRWASTRIRELIGAEADAYIEAFNAFNLRCDDAAEKSLRDDAQQMTAGAISNVRGDRVVHSLHLGQGVPWHLDIEREMSISVREAVARMRSQRAVVDNHPKEVGVSHTFNIHGANARVNINSTDQSTNVVHQGVPFEQLRTAIQSGISDGVERANLLQRLQELEAATDQESRSRRYQDFIALAANHMTIIAPYLPAITHWLQSAL